MITIKAKIDLGENGTFDTGLCNITPADSINVSSSFTEIIGQNSRTKPVNGFTLGKSELGRGQVYVKKLPYFESRKLSNSEGDFLSPNYYSISLNSLQNVGQFSVVFDEANDTHPNSININDTTKYENDARFEINLSEPTNSINITIDNWNKPNSPFILSGIYAIGDFEITSDKLISFSSNIFDRADVKYPSFGLISNSSNLTFVDLDKEAFELATEKILGAGKNITILLENTTTHSEEQICKMFIQSLTYNNDNLRANMQLKDNLEKMQDVMVEALYVDPTNPQPQTVEWYYEYLYEKTVAAGFDILTFDELDSNTKTVLSNTVIQYPVLDSDTLWNEWTKICQLCLCHMYIDNNNRVVLKYSSGS